ncbi:MAG: TRAP transporter large permease [Halieaceae bacterium]|jgi:C4-dicarboxylate transporter DctM subunit|nr:TRAP transporter large permease [Halieaceae bacterium]
MILTAGLFLALILLGTPIVFSLGVSAAVSIVSLDIPVSIIAQRVFAGLDSFTIMAIPFFIFAGVIMERGGIARRIVDFAVALVGWVTGSLLLVACVTGIGMAAVSGSGAASAAAISSTMIGEMRRRNYDVDFSAGLIAAAGTLGPVIPPSIMMVVMATTANLSIGRAFLGGVVPGLLMAAGLLAAGYVFARRGGVAYRGAAAFSLVDLGRSFLAAMPAFLIPVVVVGGIIGGLFTPTEAAAVAVVIGLLVALLWYREISLRDIPSMILWSASLSAAIMMVIATASVFSWLIASQNVPAAIGAFMHGATNSAVVFLLVMGLALLVIGMFMEGISAIMVLAPVLLPIAVSFGVDPLHFGVLMVMNLSLGMLTPPYGITLYVAGSVANRSVMQVSRKLGLPLGALLLVLLLTTAFPALVTALPDLLIPLADSTGGS